ncbi:MAG: hypothetical protein GF388_10035 [Candidatus Aegiribacteria sp.]|nr:hypothetical protein [Candidatus Aegiribacteria sp.]MBD3295371.1 hypothetical protein [Candidatus Fermentibacteria bacterium]
MKRILTSDRSVSAIVLILLVSVFMFYLTDYFQDIKTADAERRFALLIAEDCMQSSLGSIWNSGDGVYSDSVLFNSSKYYVSKTITSLSDHSRIVSISVLTPGEERVELVRNVYEPFTRGSDSNYEKTDL